MRTPEDFVNDMLSRKRSWSAILSVAGAIRGETWRSKVKAILLERRIMPEDPDKANKERDEVINKQREDLRKLNEDLRKARKEAHKKSRDKKS